MTPRERAPVLLGAIALFGLLACVYSFSIGLRATRGASITGDEPFYLLTTQSLIEDGDLDLRQQYVSQSYRDFFDHAQPLWVQSASRPDGRMLSPHEPGLSVYVVPGFVLGGLRGVQVQLLLTAAATFALTFLLVAGETRTRLLAWAATAAVGLSATAFVYATEVYPEVPAALCLVLALLVLRRSTLRARDALLLAALVTALAWLGTKYVPLAVLVGLGTMWRGQHDARVWFGSLCVLSGAVYVAWHLVVFGGLTAYGTSWAYDGAPTVEIVRAHLAIPGRAYRLIGLFVDERFGVGRWAPLLLLTLPAMPLLLKRGLLGGLTFALLGTQVLIATFVAITMMGWWFPGRTLMTVLPLTAWGVTEALVRVPRWARYALGVLGAYSALATYALARAAALDEVRIAVDPFTLRWWGFRISAALFPDYREWDAETVALHGAWLLTCLCAVGCAVWSERRSRWCSRAVVFTRDVGERAMAVLRGRGGLAPRPRGETRE